MMMRQNIKARIMNNELNGSVITMKAFLTGALLVVGLLGIMIFLSGCEIIFLAPPGYGV